MKPYMGWTVKGVPFRTVERSVCGQVDLGLLLLWLVLARTVVQAPGGCPLVVSRLVR